MPHLRVVFVFVAKVGRLNWVPQVSFFRPGNEFPVNIDAANLKTRLKRDQVRGRALESGFTEAGLVALPYIHETRDAERYKSWVDAGRAGTMGYLERANQQGELVRARANIPFPWARTAIVCMASYHTAPPASSGPSVPRSLGPWFPRSTDPAPADEGWIARYAWSSRVDENGQRRPSDYHKVLLKRLKKLDARLREEYGDFESRAYVDTGPLVERSLATAAGLGWTAKNTCLIHPRFGSFVFLGVLLTSLDMQPETAPLTVADHCGTCRRCLDACPTNALFAPYQMDATKCISYLTIEHRGPIAPELMEPMGRQVFGCDICQDVCPWNRKAPVSADPELEARPDLVNPALEWLASMDQQQYETLFSGSPVRRAGFAGLRRNVAIAMGNALARGAVATGSGQSHFAGRLKQWATDADEGLHAAATWALGKLGIGEEQRK